MLEVSMKNKYIKTLVITALIVAVVAAAYLLAAKRYDLWPFTPVVQQSPTTTNAPVPSGSTVDKDDETRTGNGSDPSPAPTPSDDGGKSTVGIILSSANKNEPNLQVRAIIQTVTASGECSLTLKNQASGVTKTYTADVQAMSSTTTCKGFDVPLSDLGSGTWDLTLVFENSTLRGEASRTIEL